MIHSLAWKWVQYQYLVWIQVQGKAIFKNLGSVYVSIYYWKYTERHKTEGGKKESQHRNVKAASKIFKNKSCADQAGTETMRLTEQIYGVEKYLVTTTRSSQLRVTTTYHHHNQCWRTNKWTGKAKVWRLWLGNTKNERGKGNLAWKTTMLLDKIIQTGWTKLHPSRTHFHKKKIVGLYLECTHTYVYPCFKVYA